MARRSFIPNSLPQKQYLRSIVNGDPYTVLYSGRQMGKTHVGAAGCLLHYHLLKRREMGRIWCLTPSVDQTKAAKDSFEEIAGWVKQGGFIAKYLAHQAKYVLYDGYEVEFKTANEPNLLRGGRCDAIWLDEAAFLKPGVIQVIAPIVAVARGPIWMTTTPNGRNWFYKDYVAPAMNNTNPRIHLVKGVSVDNPKLDKVWMAQLSATYDEATRRQEFEAEFTHKTGLVYPMWKDEYVKEPPKNYSGEVVAGIDPGANDPFCYLWTVKNGKHLWVVDEYYSEERKTLEAHAKQIYTGSWEANTVRRWCDPARAQDRIDLAQTHGLENYKAQPDLKAGINAVAEKMEQGLLHISPKCVHLLDELYNYCYKEGGEVPIDKDNHALDALRYVIYSDKDFGTVNEVITPIHSGYAAVVNTGEDASYNECIMPDGSPKDGYDAKNIPTPHSRK